MKKVAVHSGGKHALALTLSGKVWSCGGILNIVMERRVSHFLTFDFLGFFLGRRR